VCPIHLLPYIYCSLKIIFWFVCFSIFLVSVLFYKVSYFHCNFAKWQHYVEQNFFMQENISTSLGILNSNRKIKHWRFYIFHKIALWTDMTVYQIIFVCIRMLYKWCIVMLMLGVWQVYRIDKLPATQYLAKNNTILVLLFDTILCRLFVA